MTEENRSLELELVKGSIDSMLTFVQGRIEHYQGNESPEAKRHLEVYIPLAEQLEQYFRKANAEALSQEERNESLQSLGLSKRIRFILLRDNIYNLGQLVSRSVNALLSWPETGIKTIDEMQKKLDPYRLDLKDRRNVYSSKGFQVKNSHIAAPYFESKED